MEVEGKDVSILPLTNKDAHGCTLLEPHCSLVSRRLCAFVLNALVAFTAGSRN